MEVWEEGRPPAPLPTTLIYQVRPAEAEGMPCSACAEAGKRKTLRLDTVSCHLKLG